MYSGYFQERKRNILQRKFWVAAFFMFLNSHPQMIKDNRVFYFTNKIDKKNQKTWIKLEYWIC